MIMLECNRPIVLIICQNYGSCHERVTEKKRQRRLIKNRKLIWPEEILILNYINDGRERGYEFDVMKSGFLNCI